MLHNKNNEIKDLYLDEEVPLVYLDTINEANFQKAYEKFNHDLMQKYSIEPKIIALEKQIDSEFQDRKFIQTKINEKLEEEKNLQNKYNQLFPKKSHITPPYYRLKNEKSHRGQNGHLEQNEQNEFNFNKYTQTANQQAISQLFFNETAQNKNNPDFNLNTKKPIDTRSKYFSSAGKKTQENFWRNNSQQTEKIKSDSKLCRPCENKIGTNENPVSFFNEMNKILLEAKSLITKKKLPEAEKILENLVRKNVSHADLFYLLGETKRLLGQFEKSEEMLLKSMSFEMHSPFCYYSLALVYMELKNYPRAINLWKIFLKIKENNVSGYFELAKCYFETEDYIDAASSLNKAIDLENKNPDFFLLRAEAFEILNLEESAKNDYKKFKALSPNYEAKYWMEIQRLEAFGFFEEALKLKNFVQKIKNL